MRIQADTVDEYFEAVPEERRAPLSRLRKVILDNLPDGFEEALSYGFPSYVVPHSRYPDGYHVKPEEPLPFLSIANQKNFIALYHLGIYADPELLDWFKTAYAAQVPTKLDMGKSCIRFRNPAHIPFDLIGELVTRVSVDDWIATYERAVKK